MIKEKRKFFSFFLGRFLGRVLVFFYKFPPLYMEEFMLTVPRAGNRTLSRDCLSRSQMLLHPSPDQLLEAAVHWSNKYKVWDKIMNLIITSFDDVTIYY